jgi:hypothetical protein
MVAINNPDFQKTGKQQLAQDMKHIHPEWRITRG